jgi:hypothetical protein
MPPSNSPQQRQARARRRPHQRQHASSAAAQAATKQPRRRPRRASRRRKRPARKAAAKPAAKPATKNRNGITPAAGCGWRRSGHRPDAALSRYRSGLLFEQPGAVVGGLKTVQGVSLGSDWPYPRHAAHLHFFVHFFAISRIFCALYLPSILTANQAQTGCAKISVIIWTAETSTLLRARTLSRRSSGSIPAPGRWPPRTRWRPLRPPRPTRRQQRQLLHQLGKALLPRRDGVDMHQHRDGFIGQRAS